MDRELEELIQQLREANRVALTMALRHEERLKEHEEWLRQNELALVRHREFLAQHESMIARHEAMMTRHEAYMVSIDAKLDKLADLILKGRAGNGSG